MNIRTYLWPSSFDSKIVAINIFLVANAVVWYASVLRALETNLGAVGEQSWLTANSQIMIWGIHFVALVLSAFVGAKIARRINRTRFLTLWMALNAVLSLTLFGLNYTNFILTITLVSLYGISFGLGMPMCISGYSDALPVENRGRTSGLIMLITGVGIFAFAAAPLNFFEIGIALSIWRLSSLAIFLAVRSPLKTDVKKGNPSFKNVVSQRSFLAYFVPWLLFSFVNFLVPLQPVAGYEPSNTILLIQTVFLAIFSVIGGYLLDSIGRKRIAIAGFIMLGLAAAARGIDSTGMLSAYFSAVFEGAAWGLLLVLFILTLWGDLSDIYPSVKYYAIGATPFFISMFIGLTFSNQIESALPASSLFPFAAFFLFIAVLPLFYATETLPEAIMKGRDLKSYTEKALKKAQEETKKGSKNEEKDTDDTEKNEQEEDSDKYDEARKLAEKYY
jgi:MFS family permease